MNVEIKDLIDRLTILRLKREHGIDVSKELEEFEKWLPNVDMEMIKRLYDANAKIWELESEVGRLALQIREWNNKRTEIKNEIAQKYGGFKDKKMFYATGDSDDNSKLPQPAP